MPSEKRERQRVNRAQRQAAEAAAARRRRYFRLARNGLVVGAIVIGLGWIVFVVGGDENGAGATTTSADTTSTTLPATIPAGYEDYRDQPTACGAEAPPPVEDLQFDAPADQALAGEVTVTLVTSCGEIVIDLNTEGAPQAVNSFVFLARSDYYDGTVSHRIIGNFMVQLGDPTATGTGGPGYELEDELPPEDFVYDRGVVAMANSGPDTSGSQFFIVLGDASHLPNTFVVIGEVVEGFDTLDRISSIPVVAAPARPTDGPSTPVESLYIEDVVVTEA